MVDMRREFTVIASATLLYLLSVGTAQAENECRESRTSCMHEAVEMQHVCRQDCRADTQDAIAAAKAVCEDQALDDEACRDLVQASVRAVAGECGKQCIITRKEDRRACREGTRECIEATIDPLDDECVATCREEFAPCHEERRACHRDCRADLEDAIQDCRDDGLGPRELRMCIHDARQANHVCALECHDTNWCHGGMRECLSECPVDEP